MAIKIKLSFWQIINMNVGFFGIQYSFGLQQSAVNPIYDFLGASPDELPLLNLARPLTVEEENPTFLLVHWFVVLLYFYFHLVVLYGWLQVYSGF